MYVCVCSKVTETELKEMVTSNATFEHVQSKGICNHCGKSKPVIESIIEDICQENSIPISQ